uniref:uncharacterized protein LOC120329968 n=1 Tax=Styela clava TaxID=7725 RepID=UPI00193A74C6|nr:uncharacterized protein LOC120329968 [Styela clava]
MRILIIFILIYIITSSWCQDETVFHCSTKPGCQIAQCDPVSVGWDRPGFDIDEHLHDKEFPITCKYQNTAQPENDANLFPLVSRNTLDIGSIKSKLKELQGKNEIDELRKINAEQSSEIRELRKDLIEVQEKNDKLEKEMNKQQKTNNALKKAISRIEQKGVETEKPSHLQTRSRQITRPTTRTRTTLKSTPPPENCKLKIGNICYFAVVNPIAVNYNEAFQICQKRNANVGLIRNKESYNAIVNYFRNILYDWPWINIWTGIRFDPTTRAVTPKDSFIKWFSGFPHTGIHYKDYTNVYLYVHSNHRLLGMGNAPPTREFYRVICEIQI